MEIETKKLFVSEKGIIAMALGDLIYLIRSQGSHVISEEGRKTIHRMYFSESDPIISIFFIFF